MWPWSRGLPSQSLWSPSVLDTGLHCGQGSGPPTITQHSAQEGGRLWGSLSSCSTAPPLPAPWLPGPLLFSSLGHLSASAWVGDPPRPALGSAGSSPWQPPPCPAFPLQEQNGDSHHAGDWRGPGRDLLPLPVRSRKYQEGPDAAERRPREGGHSPLDSADVRVQLPRTVGDPTPGADGATGGLHCPPCPARLEAGPGSLQGLSSWLSADPWLLVDTGPAERPGHPVWC